MFRRVLISGIATVLLGIVSAGVASAQSPKAPPFKPSPSPAPTLFTMPIVDLTGLLNSNTFNIHLAYTAGLVDAQSPTGATANLYLFDQETGLPMLSQTSTDICNPCSIVLGTTANPGPAPRMVTFRLGTRVIEAGGLATGKRGFLQVQVGGDAANVAMQAESAGRFQPMYPVR